MLWQNSCTWVAIDSTEHITNKVANQFILHWNLSACLNVDWDFKKILSKTWTWFQAGQDFCWIWISNKYVTSGRRSDHVFLRSISPDPLLFISRTVRTGLIFGHLTRAPFGHATQVISAASPKGFFSWLFSHPDPPEQQLKLSTSQLCSSQTSFKLSRCG